MPRTYHKGRKRSKVSKSLRLYWKAKNEKKLKIEEIIQAEKEVQQKIQEDQPEIQEEQQEIQEDQQNIQEVQQQIQEIQEDNNQQQLEEKGNAETHIEERGPEEEVFRHKKLGIISSDEYERISNYKLEYETVPAPENPITGNRIVELGYVLQWATRLQYNHSKTCTLGMLSIKEERRQGLTSIIIYQCSSCPNEYAYHTENPNREKSLINIGAHGCTDYAFKYIPSNGKQFRKELGNWPGGNKKLSGE
ncbi:unnamed protein product [Phyllotreta striolata]|uniref:Uncharacterized protein n=1 Tax=Phyllotreta striolata TaxID=444603 RepID=A0A9N9TE38_PHYSR|nr:unnamed protein product [Phyllotreta striolata]